MYLMIAYLSTPHRERTSATATTSTPAATVVLVSAIISSWAATATCGTRSDGSTRRRAVFRGGFLC